MESRDVRKSEVQLPEKGSPYDGRERERYEGWVFATAQPSDKVGWTDFYYLNERANQDAYNFSIEYPWVDKEYPRYTRTYVVLRSDFEEPCPHQKDTADERCVLIEYKVTRLEDQVLDSLFVGVTKIFERVPAPTKIVLDRPEGVLPFNLRVGVPAVVDTTVQEDATDGETPEIVQEEAWRIEEATDTAFRKTVERTRRIIPNGNFTLDKAFEWTAEQQIGQFTRTWKIGPQTIVPRATLIKASIEDVGNNTTIMDEVVVPRVFPATEHRIEIPDPVPIEFRDAVPVRTLGVTEEGQAAPPTLGPGEMGRSSIQRTELVKRDEVVSRDVTQLPVTRVDKLLDGIQARGAEHGGIFDLERTLALGPQTIEEGFGIIKASVRTLGSGLTLKETERLSTLQGASLLLTNGGDGFTCDPAVVFNSGTFGSGAQAVATVSEIPGGGGDADPGGTFPLTFSSLGDTNGIFYFLGARYNGDVWQNPLTANVVQMGAVSNQSISSEQVGRLVDREPSTTTIYTKSGGSHLYAIDLGVGRELVVNRITVRNPDTSPGGARNIRIQTSNDGENFVDLVDMTLGASISSWFSVPVSSLVGWRYFKIFRLNVGSAANTPLSLGEIEMYGTLTITPATERHYVFDGDENGVFFYLGRRGGNGTWRNPQTAGDIVITADGLLEGQLDWIVDRQVSNVNSDGGTNRSYYFDLKAGRSLICTKMSFRQRTQFGSGTYSFTLQGRNDLGDPGDWTTLATVLAPQTPDEWKSVDIDTINGYRQFRIQSPQHYFAIGEFELYGDLILGAPVVGPSGGVTSIIVTNGGTNYQTPPTVLITGGGGSGAAATAIVAGGSVTAINIDSPGSGYTSPPTITLTVPGGGSGAAADANLTADVVTSVDITSGGSEYAEPPLVEFIGDGTGAAGTAVLTNGSVTAVTLSAGGSGYTSPPTVLFRAAGGPVATATVGYPLQNFTVSNKGAGYDAPPVVFLEGDFDERPGASAILGFGVDRILVTNSGSGYAATPSVVITGNGSTTATATATRGFPVASATITNSGSGYVTAPTIEVSGGGSLGQGAALEAFIARPLAADSAFVSVGGSGYTAASASASGDGSGATFTVIVGFGVASIAVGAGGSGYTTPPTVELTGDGTGATAHAVLTADVVTSIVIDTPGTGYTTPPTVALTGGGGTGATGTATLEITGAVKSITLTAPGSGYTEPPEIVITGDGTGAVAGILLDETVAGPIGRIAVNYGGTGYTGAPTLVISGGGGTLGTATAVLSTSGQIIAVNVIGAGNGYTLNPIISFAGGGGGSGATASASLKTEGRVEQVLVLSPGSGMTVPPTVTLVGGTPSTPAVAAANLSGFGSIKYLTLIDPGPEYTVAPLVSFVGCNGGGATALYILGTGWPILTDIITDPTEGIVVIVEKKIVPAGSARPPGHVDIYALDKYRSIQLTSRIDLSTIPPPDEFYQTHVLNLPGLLVSIVPTFARDTSEAARVNTGFSSTSVKSSVKGKLNARILDGYRGPAKARVVRTFMFGPPAESEVPNPLIITPASGTAYLTSREQTRARSLGTTGGFSYVEMSRSNFEATDAIDISGVLTGGFGTVFNSGNQLIKSDPLMQEVYDLAVFNGIGWFTDTTPTRTQATAFANVVVEIPASCPRVLLPGTTFLQAATVEKWRFGLFVQTLVYVTIPQDSCRASSSY